MKLFMACVAALSLFGCADQPTTTGGEDLVGVRPAKPSIDDPTNLHTPVNPQIFEGMSGRTHVRQPDVQTSGTFAETIKPDGLVPGVCDNCEVIAIHVPSHSGTGDHTGLDNVDMYSSDGTYLCSLTRDSSGLLVQNDCGWYHP